MPRYSDDRPSGQPAAAGPGGSTTRALANVQVLHTNSRDAEALLVLRLLTEWNRTTTPSSKKLLASLESSQQADAEATRSAGADPRHVQDAYVSLGVASYISAALPSYKRAVLWFAAESMATARAGSLKMQIAVDHGHFLQPLRRSCSRSPMNASIATIWRKGCSQTSRGNSRITLTSRENSRSLRKPLAGGKVRRGCVVSASHLQ